MDDKQLNKLNMFIKTADYLGTNATALAGVTQIADSKDALDKLIQDITDADGDAGMDTTGFTIEKSTERTELEKIMLKVIRAASAYALSTSNAGLLRSVDYGKSEVDGMRDSDFYVEAKLLHKIVQPIEANLTGFNSGPADVTSLQTHITNFFGVIQLPENKRGVKKASGIEVDELFVDGDELLDELDIYMATFEDGNHLLYNEYLSARAIDESGGGSQNTKTGTVSMNAVANIPFAAGKIQADSVLKINNPTAIGELIFYFCDLATGSAAADTETISVAAGASTEIVAGTHGFDAAHTFLNVFNPNAVGINWKVEIL